MWRTSVSSEGSDVNFDEEGDSESVSSVDEELMQWRQTIRESLEKDLQLRVAERLNLDSAYLKLKNRMFPTRLRELRYPPGIITYRKNSSIFEHSQTGRSKAIKSRRELVGDDQRELAAVASKATTAAVELPRTIATDLRWPSGNATDSVSIAHLSPSTMKCSVGDGAPPLIDSKIRFHWPEETPIVLPTPQHSYVMASSHEAMAFSRPSHLMASQFWKRSGEEKRWTVPELVYDRNGVVTSPRQSPSPICLHFESRFESGNLLQAYRVASAEYDLVLQTDLYTRKHTQWFYFSVTNVIQGITYTFNLVNFRKSDSLYNYGMQPLLYSEESARQTGVGWSRVGHGIGYYRNLFNKYRTSPAGNDAVYYTLTWKMEFAYSDDLCYISHCYPYPYSQLCQWLLQMEQDDKKWCNVTKQVMCKSLAGNDVFLLTITESNASEEELQQRKGVILTARVHPGETNSSWMMQGAVEFLTSDHPSAKEIRKLCIIKIVPMLNPDGVIVGNYRCSLAKADLNRVYRKPRKELFPTVWCTKQMIESFLLEKGTKDVIAYVDLHGHSRKHNIFTYGCHMPGCNLEQLLEGRLLPWLLFQQCPEKFSFSSCKFSVHKCKESTGRVVMWRMGITNSFTLEATFCGTKLSPMPRHFTVEDYKTMGEDLCKVISNYAKYKHSKTSMMGSLINLALHLKACSEENDSILSTAITQATSTSAATAILPAAEFDISSEKVDIYSSQQQPVDIIKNCKIEDLENESTTSGSDTSNDDEFGPSSTHKQLQRRPRKKKDTEGKKSRKKKKMVKLSTKPSVTGNSPTSTPLPLVDREKKSTHITASPVIKMPPFVNRYANRSNGGIPMFAEERLRERKAKKSEVESCSYLQDLPTSEIIETIDYHVSRSPIQFDAKLQQKSQSAKTAATQLKNNLPLRKSLSATGNFDEHPVASTSLMPAKPASKVKLPEHCNPSYFITSSDVTTLLDCQYHSRSIGPQRPHHKTKKLGHNLNISTDDSSWYSLPSICQWKCKHL